MIQTILAYTIVTLALINLYVYISTLTYLYGIVAVLCSTISVNKDSHTAIYCSTTAAPDVGEVITTR